MEPSWEALRSIPGSLATPAARSARRRGAGVGALRFLLRFAPARAPFGDRLLDVGGFPRRRAREALHSSRRHENDVFDARADVPPARIRRGLLGDVDAGLDRQRHARLELRLRLPIALEARDAVRIAVAAGVVDVQADPVARAVRVELLIGARADDLLAVSRKDAESEEAVGDHAHRRVV